MRQLKYCIECGHLRPMGRNIDRVFRTFGCAVCGGMLPSSTFAMIERLINEELEVSELPPLNDEAPAIGEAA